MHPPLKAALAKFLAHGEAAKDKGLTRMAAAKKGGAAAPEACPECGKPMVDGQCPACGYEKPAVDSGDGDLASLLEHGTARSSR